MTYPISLFYLVDRVIKSFGSFSNLHQVKFKNRVPLKFGDVNGNTDLIIFLLVNLIENAVKFVSKTGLVEIGANIKDKHVEVWVRNDGNGIPDDLRELAFDRQCQYNQTIDVGLGLSIVKRILNYYGGTIWVESDINKGNMFIFKVPNQD